MKHILYKTTNLVNNKIYIGIHSTNNLDDGYFGSGKLIIRAINKYGKENFIREILQEFDTREAALAEEAKIVDGEFIRRHDNYNCNTGGGHNWQGMVTVRDKDGNRFQVAKDDPRYLSGELVSINFGWIQCEDKKGKRIRVKTNDIRLITGELIPWSKDKIMVRDSNNNPLRVAKDDPRYLSSKLVPITKGFGIYKDSNGNYIQATKDDPRVITGELVGSTSGTKFKHKTEMKQVKCPWCNTMVKLNVRNRYHFDHCYINPDVNYEVEHKLRLERLNK